MKLMSQYTAAGEILKILSFHTQINLTNNTFPKTNHLTLYFVVGRWTGKAIFRETENGKIKLL